MDPGEALQEMEQLERELEGAWQYGSKPTEYRILAGLRFEQPSSKHGEVSGFLRPLKNLRGWLQAELTTGTGAHVGSIRIRYNWDAGTITSNYRGTGMQNWGGDIEAAKPQDRRAAALQEVRAAESARDSTLAGSGADSVEALALIAREAEEASKQGEEEEAEEAQGGNGPAKQEERRALLAARAKRREEVFQRIRDVMAQAAAAEPPPSGEGAVASTAVVGGVAEDNQLPLPDGAPQTPEARRRIPAPAVDLDCAEEDRLATVQRRFWDIVRGAEPDGGPGETPAGAAGPGTGDVADAVPARADRLGAAPAPEMETPEIALFSEYHSLVKEGKLMAVMVKSGVLARESADLTSAVVGRFADLTTVELLVQDGKRFFVRRCEGTGPDEGWVTSVVSGKAVFTLVRSMQELRSIRESAAVRRRR